MSQPQSPAQALPSPADHAGAQRRREAQGAWLLVAGGLLLGTVGVFAGMARLPLGRVAVLQYVYPLTAVLLDGVVYGKTLDALQWAGAGLMGVALWVVKSRRPR